MYYIDTDTGFVTTADVSATTKDSPYANIRSVNNYVCTTAFRCIFNVDGDILTFLNPDTRYMTALNRGSIAYNSVNLSPYCYYATSFDSVLSISHTLSSRGFVVNGFAFNSSWRNYYIVDYSNAYLYSYPGCSGANGPSYYGNLMDYSTLNVCFEPYKYRIKITSTNYTTADGMLHLNYQIYSHVSEDQSTYNSLYFQRYAQKFVGFMRSQKRQQFMYAFVMNDVFQI